MAADTTQSRPTRRRTVITGIGAVTPLAPDLDATVEKLRQGLSAIAAVRRFDAQGCRSNRGAEIQELDARAFFRAPKSIKLTDERTRFAVAAASMALRDAALTAGDFDADRAGVIVGSSGSDLQVEDLGRALDRCDAGDLAAFGRQILSGLNPLWLLVNLPNMVSAHVSIQFDLRGPNSTVMTDWIAGVQAIGEAASWIENDEADIVVAGGSDSGVLPFVYANYEEGRMFDAERFVPGDGAALFVLEEREHALRRGARIRGEVVSCAVAAPPADDRENSLAVCIEDALSRAGWRSDEVSAISPASVPHRVYDDLERSAIESTFPASPEVRVLDSNRQALGFALAAASAIDIAIHLRSDERDRNEKMIANSLGFLRQAATICIQREGQA
jgi:3-oxoacyl-[acyl-carrier-protein] synthase II